MEKITNCSKNQSNVRANNKLKKRYEERISIYFISKRKTTLTAKRLRSKCRFDFSGQQSISDTHFTATTRPRRRSSFVKGKLSRDKWCALGSAIGEYSTAKPAIVVQKRDATRLTDFLRQGLWSREQPNYRWWLVETVRDGLSFVRYFWYTNGKTRWHEMSTVQECCEAILLYVLCIYVKACVVFVVIGLDTFIPLADLNCGYSYVQYKECGKCAKIIFQSLCVTPTLFSFVTVCKSNLRPTGNPLVIWSGIS